MTAKKRALAVLGPICLLFFVLANATDISLTGTGLNKGYLADLGPSRTPSAVALSHAAGEFRIAAANLLWLNVVDHYHHQYMKSGGDWSRNKDVLPLIRMIVILDPHFTQAYDVGSLILCQLGRYQEASTFLKQGVKDNPTDWGMVYDQAMLYAWYKNDAQDALPYALKARDLAADPFDRHRLDLLCDTLERDARLRARPRVSSLDP
jgi:tetratricopeptide (TPR) repeat protein